MGKIVLSHAILPAFILALCLYFVSCDGLQTETGTDTAFMDSYSSLTFTMHKQHLEWKDEVTVHQTGWIEFRRLEGEEKPPAKRVLHDDEFLHFKELVPAVHAYEGRCSGYDENNVILYSISLHREEGGKTVLCDGTSLARIDDNELLKPVISLLRDFRMSLIGEIRFNEKLRFDLRPEKAVVDLDEPVIMRYGITNITNSDVTMGFPSSGQLGFKIYHEGKVIYSSGLFGTLGVLTSWRIPMASTDIKKYEWDHSTMDGSIYHDRKVKSGTYTIIQFLQNGNSPYRATEITITEQGGQKLQPRLVYNRYEDPSTFFYELNNRISEPFSFEFSTDRQIGFQIREYDTQTQSAGDVIYSSTSGSSSGGRLIIEPFDEYIRTEKWDLTDNDGNPVPDGFYWAEMWLLDQQPDYRTGRRVFIGNY